MQINKLLCMHIHAHNINFVEQSAFSAREKEKLPLLASFYVENTTVLALLVFLNLLFVLQQVARHQSESGLYKNLFVRSYFPVYKHGVDAGP